jgi:uncharacterized protein with PQ loop repeat
MDKFVVWVGIAIVSLILVMIFLIQVLRLMTEQGSGRFVAAFLLILSGAGLYWMWRVGRRMLGK